MERDYWAPSLSFTPADIVEVDETTAIADAIRTMAESGTDYVAVTQGGRLRVFALRKLLSIADDVDSPVLREAVAPWSVPVEYCQLDDPIDRIVERIRRLGAVATGSPEATSGVLTTGEVLRQLAEAAEPFLIVADIELALRAAIQTMLPPESRVEKLDALLRDADGKPRGVASLDDLSMGDYQTLILSRDLWPRFEVVFQNRSILKSKLTKVVRLRNRLFHFRGRLSPADLTFLRDERDWVRERVSGVVPRPRADVLRAIK